MASLVLQHTDVAGVLPRHQPTGYAGPQVSQRPVEVMVQQAGGGLQ